MVNNAGVALGTPPAHENPIADVETMLRTNVSSVMAFVSTFAPGMVERNEGHIVNISSIAGHEAYPGGSVYCATKHAIDAYTTSMRRRPGWNQHQGHGHLPRESLTPTALRGMRHRTRAHVLPAAPPAGMDEVG